MLEQPGKKSTLLEYAEAIVTAVLLALFVRTFLVQAYTIPSGSMLQTVQIGDFVIVNKTAYGVKIPFTDSYAYKGEGPRHGDIIVFKYPGDTSIDYIKRVVGVPGDVLEMRAKKLFRNGKEVSEPYIQITRPGTNGPLDNFGPITVPADSYFAMGDNRDNSSDSRVWGMVPRGYIHGKAWRIYWSWDGETHTPRWSRLGHAVE
ncbi:MAG: signal peptidase I [Mailhella sp.]|nr:signal peptidase I [Mailhella sp.]